MRLLSLIILFTFSTCSLAGEQKTDHGLCGYRTVYDGTVFTFSIRRSFHAGATFKLCERKDARDSFLLVQISRGKIGIDETRQVKLDSERYAKLVHLYEAALDYNVKDSTMGLDGSTWCLETERGFTYSKACFWSPGPADEAAQRGIAGFYILGQELWKIADLEPEFGQLYQPRLTHNYVLNRTVGDMLRSNQSISALGRLARRQPAMTFSGISDISLNSIASAIFAGPSPRVLETYSEPGQEIREFHASDDILGYVSLKRAAVSGVVQLSIWYPDTLGCVEVTRLSLDPSKCNGHTFRYRADGWGLISVQLNLASTSVTSSCVSANTESRANKWASTYPELGPPSHWSWPDVSRHSRRLTRALRNAV